MLFPPIDPNARFRHRRAQARRRKRARRAVLIGLALGAVAAVGVGAQFVGAPEPATTTPPGSAHEASLAALSPPSRSGPRPLPLEIRGVHVTMGLASIPGKLDEYLALEKKGMTVLELDVKDESGEVGFVRPAVRLAHDVGAARPYYAAPRVARLVHERGLYLVGRIVVFEDPVLSRGRPDLAVRGPDGSVWTDDAGLGWTNPYDRRVWKYNADIAVAAARAGFDEIMFDYVRFPSDGDVSSAVYPNRGRLSKREAVPAFLRYASRRLRPHGVRVSAALFGLSASRDLGIGQLPRRFAPHVDTVYAMTYPSLFGPGELGLEDPSRAPGETVARALAQFEKRLRGHDVLLVPWVQDFSFSRAYGLPEVQAQVDAARVAGSKGFLLWNAEGLYTDGVLAPAS